MDRPIGNTQEVIGECEKWYVDAHRAESPSNPNIESNRLTILSIGMPGTPSAASRAPKPSVAISRP